ncbi:MAG TPA: GNAT family N-acetyltransferase [Pyrinomonadaceae bacterium]|nr:GNAT family N-acetyltransferase [Pyrinomonadaceae bacterium]
MTSSDFEVSVRPARDEDGEFILALVPRLMEFGPPPWYDAAQMVATDLETIGRVLKEPPANTAVFVAVGDAGARLGFIHLNTTVDYFTREEVGHVSDVVVAPGGEGRGVGRALMAAAEEWARGRGYRLLTLNAFARNTRARRLYERLGYGEDMVKYVKQLR